MSLLSLFKQKKDTSDDADSGEFSSRSEEESNSHSAGVKQNRNRSQTQNSSKNKATDAALPEKKRARRRLIGALALALAAVIGLPMVLDSEPKVHVDDISVQIPSKDKPASVAGKGISPSPPADLDEPGMVAKNSRPDLDPLEEIISLPPVVADIAPEKTKITPAPVAKATEQSSAAIVEVPAKTDTKPGTNKPSANLTAGANTLTATTATTADAHNQKASVKPSDASDALRAMAILEGKSPLKAPAKAEIKVAAIDKSATVAGPGFTLQVAALATQEKVSELQKKLKDANLNSFTQKVTTSTGVVIRVRVGPFGSRDEAESARAKLVKLGLNGTLIPN